MLKGKLIRIMVVGIISIFMISLVPIKSYGAKIDESENKVELKFIENDEEIVKPPKVKPDSNNNYKPSEPQNVKNLLPQTGETILSFMFVLIGISIILLIVGVHTMKRVVGIYSYY